MGLYLGQVLHDNGEDELEHVVVAYYHDDAEVNLGKQGRIPVGHVVHHPRPVFDGEGLENSKHRVAKVAERTDPVLRHLIVEDPVVLERDAEVQWAAAIEVTRACVGTIAIWAANPGVLGALRPVGGIYGLRSEPAPVIGYP